MPRLVNATCPLMPRFANTVCPLPISSVPTTKSYYNQKRYACHPGFHISESTENNKQFLLNQIIWMGVSFGISIAISMLVPFPISLDQHAGPSMTSLYWVYRLGVFPWRTVCSRRQLALSPNIRPLFDSS
jgi:hypothetical protein